MKWVPEEHIFNSGGECIEKFPDQAAAGLYDYEEMKMLLDALKFYTPTNIFTQDGFSLKFLRDQGETARKAIEEFQKI